MGKGGGGWQTVPQYARNWSKTSGRLRKIFYIINLENLSFKIGEIGGWHKIISEGSTQ
jgi:hypothetical protein